MKNWKECLIASVLLGIGFSTGWVVAKGGSARTEPSHYQGKEPKAAAEALLSVAAVQAGDGTWENIGVGRVYYLSGNKEKGEEFFQKALGGKSGKTDLRKISRIYAQAGDMDKAVSAMQKALALDEKDETYQTEMGAILNLKGDRAKAEELFGKSFKSKPEEVWNTINAAGSYVGVVPQ